MRSGRGRPRVVMVAAENDALRGAKVGGIADVIRDLPAALAPLGWRTTVIVPSYGFLHELNGAEKISDVTFPFGGREEYGELYRAEAPPGTSAPSNARAAPGGHPGPGTPDAAAAVEQLILHHPAIGGEPIYYHDPKERVYARDSTKFALFCSAAGQYLRTHEEPYVLHLHDWHTGYLFLLAALHPAFRHLRDVRTVFTIHNVGYQGTRPMQRHAPSVEDWFPELFRSAGWVRSWKDPRYDIPTFTPMLAGIRRAACVTTVSPTYAEEITRPSDHAAGVYGGEGLEDALRAAREQGRLAGILNGVTYPPDPPGPAVADAALLRTAAAELAADTAGRGATLREEALDRLRRALARKDAILLSSITRITEQKVRLLLEPGGGGATALESILGMLDAAGGAYVFVGTGAERFEAPLREAFGRHESFVFLNGFYRESADALFRRGNLFVMPSSYEPCGITQMMAMREGQPCLVHAVGGLRDTVIDGVNGFTFSGTTLAGKVDNFAAAAARAISLFRDDPARWREIAAAARASRFGWEESARAYAGLFEGGEGG